VEGKTIYQCGAKGYLGRVWWGISACKCHNDPNDHNSLEITKFTTYYTTYKILYKKLSANRLAQMRIN